MASESSKKHVGDVFGGPQSPLAPSQEGEARHQTLLPRPSPFLEGSGLPKDREA